MNDTTRRNMEIFIENFKTAQRFCRWDGDKAAAVMAATYLGNTQPTSFDTIKQAEQTIKQNEGAFSDFRSGYSKKAVLAAVSGAADQEQALKDIRAIKESLKPGIFGSFEFGLAACLIYMTNEDGNYERAVDRTLQIMNEVKSKHPILGSERQLTDCTLIAMTDKDPAHASEDFEECYNEIVRIYGRGSISLRTGAAISIFGGGADVKAEKVKALHQNLKQARFHFTTEGLEMIGLMSGLFGDNAQDVIREMQEVSGELSKVKGFGSWGLGEKLKNLVAATIVIASTVDDPKAGLFAKQILISILCLGMQSEDDATFVTTMM